MLDHPVQKGLLRAAVPFEKLGQRAYLNDVSHEELKAHLTVVS